MQYLLILIVLMLSAALMLFALPIILYVVPLIVVGLLISLGTSNHSYRSKTVKH